MTDTPTLIKTSSSFVIAQISDLHLDGDDGKQTFLEVLSVATEQADLLLLTGDLVNDGKATTYDWLFETLTRTRLPFLCLMGNHDVTHEMGTYPDTLKLLPADPDPRLVDLHKLVVQVVDTSWQILVLNSAVAGQIFGRLSEQALRFLYTHLQTGLPTIVAMHHHPKAVGSRWIDAYQLQNSDEFWQVLHHFGNVQAVLSGHVHQAHALPPLYTCPATSRQFLPFADHFTLDVLAPGLRFVQLVNNSTLETWVKRVDNVAL